MRTQQPARHITATACCHTSVSGHTCRGMEVTAKGTVELLGMVQSPFLPLQLQEQRPTEVR